MNPIRISLIAGIILSAAVSSFAQSFTEGKITYDITMNRHETDNEAMDAKIQAMAPKSATQYVKGKKSRMEMTSAMGTTVSITDYAAGQVTTLMDMNGRKMRTERTFNDSASYSEFREMKKTGEKKTIAGYACEKVLINYYNSSNDQMMEMEWWVTDQIQAPVPADFSVKGLNGFPLEFDFAGKGPGHMNFHMTASKVEKTAVSDSQFSIPAGYDKAPATSEPVTPLNPSELKEVSGQEGK